MREALAHQVAGRIEVDPDRIALVVLSDSTLSNLVGI